VPTTTDIAFAVGVLSLATRRAPRGLRMLLLTLSIADDIAAVVIIAAFYTARIDLLGVLIAAGATGAQAALQRAGRGGIVTYSVAGIAIWSALLGAGVHPTLAGVVLGLITPVTAGKAPVHGLPHAGRALRMEAALHPWVSYLILPLFALANAGVDLRDLKPAGDLQWQVAAGIIAGLAFGKPLGILLASALTVRAGLGTVPAGVRPPHLVLFGCLGGIGFTMSMFLCNLAFTDPTLLATAKAAVLAASALAATLGMCAGRLLIGARAAPASGTPPVKKGH
jgi:NhaA family Na+:H+ antiporter